MAKFHINNDGDVGRCTAETYPCRFGSAETHYASAGEAREAYERRMVAMLDLEHLSAKTIIEPGEPRFEEIGSPDGSALGTVTYREGLYLASTHDGRRPYSHGQYDSREEALSALVANGGRFQKQK